MSADLIATSRLALSLSRGDATENEANLMRRLVPSLNRILAVVAAGSLALTNVVTGQIVKSGAVSGSAFAVSADGKLLTNSHVVEGCSEVSVFGRSGHEQIARVEARDTNNDLALLGVDSTFQSIATFRTTPVRSGEDVIALGFPLRGLLATDLNVSKGIVSATAGLLNDTGQLQISAAVQPGNSGGPLLDVSASVVGVVVAKLDAIAVARALGDIPQNVNFAIKAEVAEIFLRSHEVEPLFSRGVSVQRIAVPDAVERARRYTFVVECDPSRLTAEQRAAAAEAAAELREIERRKAAEAEAQRDRERQALLVKEQQERRAAEEKAVERRRRAEFWATHNMNAEDCVRPASIGIGTLDWNLMSAEEQWAACTAAGTIRSRCPECTGSKAAPNGNGLGEPRVLDAGFASEPIDLHKASIGGYQNSFVQGSRWISMYLRISGLRQEDDIELSLFAPGGKNLITRRLKLDRATAGNTILWVGKRRSALGGWQKGQYTGRVHATRRGIEVLDFSTAIDVH